MGRSGVSPSPDHTVRRGSPVKRAAILDAARRSFLEDGFERTSVDAIAAAAEVSKRTVYDYFGDKRRLLLAVVDDLGSRLMHTIELALEHLDAPDDVEQALNRFATTIVDSAVGSHDHLALLRLVSTERRNLPELDQGHWVNDAPEHLLADRLGDLARRRLLVIPDPRLAADHLVALTLGPPLDFAFRQRGMRPSERHRRIAAGIHVFLAAYGPVATLSRRHR